MELFIRKKWLTIIISKKRHFQPWKFKFAITRNPFYIQVWVFGHFCFFDFGYLNGAH